MSRNDPSLIRNYLLPGQTTFPQFDGEAQLELARRARGGDVAARNELVTSYLPAVAFYVRKRCTRHRDEFDDCAQEVVARLMRAAERFDAARGDAVAAYFFKTMRRAINAFNRRQGLRSESFVSPDDSREPRLHEVVDDRLSPLAHSEHRGETELFAAELLQHATPRERQVLTRVFRGESFQRVGKQIGVSPERVRQLKERGLDRIRRAEGVKRRP